MPATKRTQIRSTVTHEELDGLRIVVPSILANWPMKTLFAGLLGIWTLAGLGALVAKLGGWPVSGTSVFLGSLVWLFVEGFLLHGMVESQSGRYVLLIQDKTLMTWREFGGSVYGEHVDEIVNLRGLRFASSFDESRRRPGVVKRGWLAFNTRHEMRLFGDGLSEYEVKRIIETSQRHVTIPDLPVISEVFEPLPIVS